MKVRFDGLPVKSIRSVGLALCSPIHIALFASLFAASALADGHVADGEESASHKSYAAQLLDAAIGGKPTLDVNFRWENAKADGLQTSNAATVRTRLGYQTKPFQGVSGFFEFENVASPSASSYFDAVEQGDRNKTPIADPEIIQANRFWLNLDQKGVFGIENFHVQLKTGRQRIKLDDDRWIGNVGWRQNEQTFDATRFQTNLGVKNLNFQYIFSWEVNRIFGDEVTTGNRGDFGMRSHWLNASYSFGPKLKAVGFAYLIDASSASFAGFATNSSNTYGTRLTGTIPVTEKFSVSYQGSYAYQTDAADNAVDYDANYYLVDGHFKFAPVGGIGVGYEVLGTDNGRARIITPFSTAHKFNGFADVFLNNGGLRGLRDLYVYLTPNLSSISKKWKFKFAFHQFYDDQGGDNLGQEYDIVTVYKLNKYVSFLYKLGYYDGGKDRSPRSTVRNILQTTLKF